MNCLVIFFCFNFSVSGMLFDASRKKSLDKFINKKHVVRFILGYTYYLLSYYTFGFRNERMLLNSRECAGLVVRGERDGII